MACSKKKKTLLSYFESIVISLFYKMTSYKYYTIFSYLLLLFIVDTNSRKHKRILENDTRNYFRISKFGFWKGGNSVVKLNLTFNSKFSPKLGLTITKTVSDSITPYVESQQNTCLLADDVGGNIQIISFLLDLKNNQLLVNCSSSFPFLNIKTGAGLNITLEESQNFVDMFLKASAIISQKLSAPKEKAAKDPAQDLAQNGVSSQKGIKRVKRDELTVKRNESNGTAPKVNAISHVVCIKSCSSFAVPFTSEIIGPYRKISDLQFQISMDDIESVGLYSIYFHNCPEPEEPPLPVSLSIAVVEQNGDNFLSVGEVPLPNLYFLMSFIFFVTGYVWIAVLRKKWEEIFIIHYLMGLLVYLQSLSFLFHGINYHIIARDGYPMEFWAVLYYITHLLKVALLFTTIVLIGTGWAFLKQHILSSKINKVFRIVIPLQVLANVAKIFMEESEEGEYHYYMWREIFILIDLICCGVILFTAAWSIRHLRKALQTDGKAVINLESKKLLKKFYIMIFCYIYFTRIIAFLLKMNVTFQYEWLEEVFCEAATFTFFIVTGISFQPTVSNPYIHLSQEDDLKMDEVITQSGFTENISRTVRSQENAGQEDKGTAN